MKEIRESNKKYQLLLSEFIGSLDEQILNSPDKEIIENTNESDISIFDKIVNKIKLSISKKIIERSKIWVDGKI